MKAFLLICTSIKSSILSSLSIVWFDRHELIMNDQAVPLKHEQPEYTEEEGRGYVCVWVCVCCRRFHKRQGYSTEIPHLH